MRSGQRARSRGGVVTSPHSLASESGAKVLRRGGNAIEAALATAATLAVVYPHMNSIGGDGFWLIADEAGCVRGLDGAGAAGRDYSIHTYLRQGLEKIPERGPLAANTVAGIVGLWQSAYEHSCAQWKGRLSWGDLLEDAVNYAARGFPLSEDHCEVLRERRSEIETRPGFAEAFLAPLPEVQPGVPFVQPALARTLSQLQSEGGESFYRGPLAARIARGLSAAGSLLSAVDLKAYRARWVEPISCPYRGATVVNMPPPTQGLASLVILGLLERRDFARFGHLAAAYIHEVVEATKLAFEVRDRYVTDPDFSQVPVDELLAPAFLDSLVARIDPNRARPYPPPVAESDTVWYGAVDSSGRAVSAIQSIYHPFGSAVVVGDTGILWQNRGCAFSLDRRHVNCIAAGKRTLHTLNPAMVFLDNRLHLVYGTMGGEGQPQTQAALVTRVRDFGLSLAEAIDAPRWLLGRTWGSESVTLKLERRFSEEVRQQLEKLGHRTEWVAPYCRMMGHAGLIRIGSDKECEAVSDPRSDGAAVGA